MRSVVVRIKPCTFVRIFFMSRDITSLKCSDIVTHVMGLQGSIIVSNEPKKHDLSFKFILVSNI